jgi:uncharacterized protein (DUF1015 family)
MGAHEQTGIAGCFSVDDYESDVIRKHERTRRDKEDDRTRHIIELRAQTGVVFLTYRSKPAVDAIAGRVTQEPPLFDFTAQDGVRHTIWRASQPDTDAAGAAFVAIPALYIADGHHRAASAARARGELASLSGSGEADTFIAVAFPDNQMHILPYHRVVRDLAGRTPSSFLEDLRTVADVVEGPAAPRRKGEVSFYLDGRWYVMDVSKTTAEDGSHAGSLDVALLQRNVLERILKIGDVRSDKRIDFVGGARGTKALEDMVNAAKAAVAFSMYAVTIDDLMTISDAGGIMPPKSTWFEPKLRDGLLVHLI